MTGKWMGDEIDSAGVGAIKEKIELRYKHCRPVLMSHILEVNPKGDLSIPASLVDQLLPGKRYFLEIQGETLILKPASTALDGQQANVQARIDRLRAWAAQPRPGNPHITDEALRREHLYDA
jgi:hypothetical protein